MHLGSGGGIWTRRSCGRGSPSGDRSRPWAAAAGMARAGSAWLLLLLAIWVRLWHRGPGRGQHVRPACGSARPPAGPSWTRGELPPATGVGACVPGRRGPEATGEAAGLAPCPPLRLLRATGAGGIPKARGDPSQGVSAGDTTLRGCRSGGGRRLGRDARGLGEGAPRPRLRALHLCECRVGSGCFPPRTAGNLVLGSPASWCQPWAAGKPPARTWPPPAGSSALTPD